jgi:MraZ protein
VEYGGAQWSTGEANPVILGEFPLRLDEKGRLVLPAKWRSQFMEGLVIAKSQEHCLSVFPMAEFVRVAERLKAAPTSDRRTRDYVRVFFASAYDEVPDRQGRVTVPAALRDYGGLTRDCVAIGANTRAEVWDSAAWDSYLGNSEPGFADLAEEVLPGVL